MLFWVGYHNWSCGKGAKDKKVSMWQLDTAATNASPGSTYAGFENGTGTTDGEAEAGTVTPPSKVPVCSREHLPARNSGLERFQLMVALWLDIEVLWIGSAAGCYRFYLFYGKPVRVLVKQAGRIGRMIHGGKLWLGWLTNET